MQLPGELLRSLENVKGFDEPAFTAVHHSGEQVTSIRLNPHKALPASLPHLSLEQVPWCKDSFYLPQRPSFTMDPLFHAGAYYVQEASSMFLSYILELLVDVDHHKVVLDLCAAPGGKSTLLSSFFMDGIVVANEVIKSRVSVLQQNLTKWGNTNTIVTNNDSRDFNKLPGFFDVIVADVPCSGSGLFRKDPGAVNEWSLANVNLCCQRQQRILADVIPCLKQDGIFIYSTCSYSTQEDEDILDWIVQEFQLEPLKLQVPAEWGIVETIAPATGARGYRFFPDKLKGEGFFIAAFRQFNEVHIVKRREAAVQTASQKELQLLNTIIEANDVVIYKQGELFNALPSAFFTTLKQLASSLYIKQAGVALGSFKGKGFVPDPALALSTIQSSFPSIELDHEQALAYLKKQDLHIEGPQGWCKVLYQGLGLGWIKILPNRTNNYYPSEWRILKP